MINIRMALPVISTEHKSLEMPISRTFFQKSPQKWLSVLFYRLLTDCMTKGKQKPVITQSSLHCSRTQKQPLGRFI